MCIYYPEKRWHGIKRKKDLPHVEGNHSVFFLSSCPPFLLLQSQHTIFTWVFFPMSVNDQAWFARPVRAGLLYNLTLDINPFLQLKEKCSDRCSIMFQSTSACERAGSTFLYFAKSVLLSWRSWQSEGHSPFRPTMDEEATLAVFASWFMRSFKKRTTRRYLSRLVTMTLIPVRSSM